MPHPDRPSAIVHLDAARARRLLLAAQGLHRSRPFGTGLAGAQRALEHLGYVQIDTIAVIERAHHHVLFTRLPDYRPGVLDRLVAARRAFEYWSHAASILPMRDFRFALPRMHALRARPRHWATGADARLTTAVLDRIRADGPLRARDFADPDATRKGWWDWKPAKRALEHLYMTGELMVSARDGFEKVYDLPERVLPADVDTRVPDVAQTAAHLLDTALRAGAVVTPSEVTWLRQDPPLRQALAATIAAQVADGTLARVQVDGRGPVRLVRRADLDAPLPRASATMRWLSPFDSAVIHRERTAQVLGLDYQIECYVPEAKRRFGYFCLPMLLGDRLVGRVDARADRRAAILELRAVHIEDGSAPADRTAAAFAAAAQAFATFNGCTAVALGAVAPRAWQRPLQQALRAAGG